MIAVLTFVVIKWVVNVCDLAEKDGDYGTNQSFKCDNYVSATNDTNTVVGITLSDCNTASKSDEMLSGVGSWI